MHFYAPAFQVKELFSSFCKSSIADMQAGQEDDEMLQGVDWVRVEAQVDMELEVDKELPGEGMVAYDSMRVGILVSWMSHWHIMT